MASVFKPSSSLRKVGNPPTRTIDCLAFLMLTWQPGAKVFAGKVITNEDRAFMFPIVGGRNMWVGAAMLALTVQGQRRAVGTILVAGMLGGSVDAWWCYKNGSEKWLGHIIGSSIGLPLSDLLLQ